VNNFGEEKKVVFTAAKAVIAAPQFGNRNQTTQQQNNKPGNSGNLCHKQNIEYKYL